MENDRLRILVIGCGGREHAIVKALSKSKYLPRLFCFGTFRNPGIYAFVDAYITATSVTNVDEIVKIAKKFSIDFVVIGNESTLESGVTDVLHDTLGVPCIGPYKSLARIETSKEYCRQLLKKYGMDHLNPVWKAWGADNHVKHQFNTESPKSKLTTQANYQELKSRQFSKIDRTIRQFITQLNGNFVIKSDGLKGGKGVKVSGDHFASIDDGIEICQELYNKRERFIIEEKLDGEEFSMFSLCDGKHFVHCPVAKDYKRATNGDRGANTGGMGSFTMADHSMPFLTSDELNTVKAINEKVIRALMSENGGLPYKGFVYGSFMKSRPSLFTSSSAYSPPTLKIIEYNARLGDPEGINLLEILDTDFVDVCLAIINENLPNLDIKFKNVDSKCVYFAPHGYPDANSKTISIDKILLNEIINRSEKHVELYISGINYALPDDTRKSHSGNVYLENIKTVGTGSVELVYQTVECKKMESQSIPCLDILVTDDSHNSLNNDDVILEMDDDDDDDSVYVLGDDNSHSECQLLDIDSYEPSKLHTTGSRTFAIIGIGAIGITKMNNILNDMTLNAHLSDRFFHRSDIGKKWLSKAYQGSDAIGLYAKSGVDVNACNEAVGTIQTFVQNTYSTESGQHVVPNEGGFGGVIKIPVFPNYDSPVLINSTDSVGSKSIFVKTWWGRTRGMQSLGHDIVNHCVNDILVQSPSIHPWTFMDYYATHSLNPIELRWFIKGVSEACIAAGCTLIGGETAEIPGIYKPESNDLVGAITGITDFKHLLQPKKTIVEGDLVYGIKSYSPHTNGYTLIQYLITQCTNNNDHSYLRYVDNLCKSHRCYLNDIKKLESSHVNIKGLCHITGGGFIDNPKRILPEDLTVNFKWDFIHDEMPEWMKWIMAKMYEYDANCTNEEVHKTFNCGYGMLVVVDNEIDPTLIDETDIQLIGKIIKKKNENKIEINFVV